VSKTCRGGEGKKFKYVGGDGRKNVGQATHKNGEKLGRVGPKLDKDEKKNLGGRRGSRTKEKRQEMS